VAALQEVFSRHLANHLLVGFRGWDVNAQFVGTVEYARNLGGHQIQHQALHLRRMGIGHQDTVASAASRNNAGHDRQGVQMPVGFMRIAAEPLNDPGILPADQNMDMFAHKKPFMFSISYGAGVLQVEKGKLENMTSSLEPVS